MYWENIIKGKVLALHIADLGLTFGIIYGPHSVVRRDL